MTGIDVDQSKAREKLANDGQHVVGHVFALRASNKERGLCVACLLWVLVGKVSEVVERPTENVQGDAEPLDAVFG